METKETGRTMLEMIAVIVLIILLSIGSLSGYKQVVARHQATVLHQDIMVEASSRRGDNAQKKSTYDSGLGSKTRQGLTMKTERSSDTFTIIVNEVSAALCSPLKKKDWKDALRIKINNDVYKPYDPDKPNDPNQIQCPSGDDNFNLSLIFPYKVSAIEAYQDFCHNDDDCMRCQTCHAATGTCQNDCEAGTCVAGTCVGQACEEGKTLVGTTCQPCKTDYSATCSSCNSTTTPYWTEDRKCVCHEGSCGTNFYCDANGACQECPEHATCADGTFTCDTGYVKSESEDSCVALSCSKGETLVETTCQPCQTDYSATCSSCNSTTTPYWTEDKKCVCHEGSCGDGAYCDANGVCQECPDHATCADGTFTCDEGYYKSASNDECLENPCTIPHTSPVCIYNKRYPGKDVTTFCNDTQDYYYKRCTIKDAQNICWCDPGYWAVSSKNDSYQDWEDRPVDYIPDHCELQYCYLANLNQWSREGLRKAQDSLSENNLFQWCLFSYILHPTDTSVLRGESAPFSYGDESLNFEKIDLGTFNGLNFYTLKHAGGVTWMSAYTWCYATDGRLASINDLKKVGICPNNVQIRTWDCSSLNNIFSSTAQNIAYWLDDDCKSSYENGDSDAGVECEKNPTSNSYFGLFYNPGNGYINSGLRTIHMVDLRFSPLCITNSSAVTCTEENYELDENGNCVCMQGYHESEEGCVMCAEETPYWDGNQCTVCPAETPYWDGSQCVACSGDTPIWNGTECTEALPEGTCTDNTNCKDGEYCNYYDYSTNNMRSANISFGPDANSGVCLTTDTASGTNDYGFTLSTQFMDWFSAKKFCESLNKTMVSLEDTDCTTDGCDWSKTATGNLSSTYWWIDSSYTSGTTSLVATYAQYLVRNVLHVGRAYALCK